MLKLDGALLDAKREREEAIARLPGYQAREGIPFREQAMLDEKRQALADLEAELETDNKANDNDECGVEESEEVFAA